MSIFSNSVLLLKWFNGSFTMNRNNLLSLQKISIFYLCGWRFWYLLAWGWIFSIWKQVNYRIKKIEKKIFELDGLLELIKLAMKFCDDFTLWKFSINATSWVNCPLPHSYLPYFFSSPKWYRKKDPVILLFLVVKTLDVLPFYPFICELHWVCIVYALSMSIKQ